jgi:hypothetical protein
MRPVSAKRETTSDAGATWSQRTDFKDSTASNPRPPSSNELSLLRQFGKTVDTEGMEANSYENSSGSTESQPAASLGPELKNTDNKNYKNLMAKIRSYDNTRTYKHIERAFTTSTLHRLGSVYENKSWPLKIILGVCFGTSVVYCTYQIIMTIINFAAYGVLTSSSVNYEIPAEFPGLIIK